MHKWAEVLREKIPSRLSADVGLNPMTLEIMT